MNQLDEKEQEQELSKKSLMELKVVCKIRGVKSYTSYCSNKTKDKLVKMIMDRMKELHLIKQNTDHKEEPTSDVVPMEPSTIEGLDTLKRILEHPKAQRGLIRLYAESQSECKKNGVCGMEIGMAREKDMSALLSYYLPNQVNFDVDNTLPEDMIVCGEKISLKHSSGKVGTSVKVKWTAADESVDADVISMINQPSSYYPHLLLVYINARKKEIEIICISSHTNKTVIKELGRAAFKVPKGNSRGIQYSLVAMKELMRRQYFTITIKDADVDGGEDPIARRLRLLHQLDQLTS
jgi:hypothetical protein